MIKYQPKIYRISKVIAAPESSVGRERYELKMAYAPYFDLCNERNADGHGGAKVRAYTAARLYASDMVPCTLTTNKLSVSVIQAMKLNGLKKTRLNDLVTHDLDEYNYFAGDGL